MAKKAGVPAPPEASAGRAAFDAWRASLVARVDPLIAERQALRSQPPTRKVIDRLEVLNTEADEIGAMLEWGDEHVLPTIIVADLDAEVRRLEEVEAAAKAENIRLRAEYFAKRDEFDAELGKMAFAISQTYQASQEAESQKRLRQGERHRYVNKIALPGVVRNGVRLSVDEARNTDAVAAMMLRVVGPDTPMTTAEPLTGGLLFEMGVVDDEVRA